jgi:hypothetical protein
MGVPAVIGYVYSCCFEQFTDVKALVINVPGEEKGLGKGAMPRRVTCCWAWASPTGPFQRLPFIQDQY